MPSPEMQIQRSESLEGARADFAASIGRRVDALRTALTALADAPQSVPLRDSLERRVHAMEAAAKVLGFEGVAGALRGVASALVNGQRQGPDTYLQLTRVLDTLPSLAWGGPVAIPPPAPPHAHPQTAPRCVLVYGNQALADVLRASGEMDIERCERPSLAHERAQAIGPDAIVVDADRPGAEELLEGLSGAGVLREVPLVVVGTYDQPERASLPIALGASRVLTKPVGPDQLRQTLAEVTERPFVPPLPTEPIGDVSVEELSQRVAEEIRRGLLEAAEPDSIGLTVPFGEGTDVLATVWGAVARIRELTTMRSGGTVRFSPTGPEGAIPWSPWVSTEQSAGRRTRPVARGVHDTPLKGRRAVVVDDDPAVVWFMTGLLNTAGVECLEAHDGHRAFELATVAWPDLVISDMNMPGLDGFSLCRLIKRDVALRDVPVLLLSWKEDFLQRARELGANADAYLRKEASVSVVLDRVREVLRPRARVESRLERGGDVRGRLEGLTPRLILQLAAERGRDARVSIRDASYLYELELRGGRLRSATRTSEAGELERGEKVVGAVLGADAGRFSVTRSTGPCREDFDGTLMEIIAPIVSRARAAQRALQADSLAGVYQVGIDEAAIAGYLPAMPAPAAEVLRRLLRGVAPRHLLLDGATPAWLLESVLADVARHGAVRSVEGPDGLDLLELSRLGGAPPRRVAVCPEPPTPAPVPLFSFDISPGPGVALGQPSTPVPVRAEECAASSALAPPSPPAQERRGEVSKDPEGWASRPTEVPAHPEVVHQPLDAPAHVLVAAEPSEPMLNALDQGALGAPAAQPPALPPARPLTFPPRPLRGPPAQLPQVQQARETEGGQLRQCEAPTAPGMEPGQVSLEEASPVPPVILMEAPSASSSAGNTGTAPAGNLEHKRIEYPVRSSQPAGRASVGNPDTQKHRALDRAGLLGVLRVVGMTGVAALVSFGAVRLWLARASESPAPAANTPTASSPAASAEAHTPPPTAAAAASAHSPSGAHEAEVEDLPLPPGFALSEGKGLLEIATGGRESLYVGDAFMGRGPTRRIPVDAGIHAVRIRTDGDSATYTVKVAAGRRARLQVGAASPSPEQASGD